MADINNAVVAILDRHDACVEAEAYYEGTNDEIFAHPNIRRLLGRTAGDFRLNFAATVVDAVLNRVELATVTGATEAADAVINKVWEQNDLILEADEIHKRALIYGDCFAIVWPDDEGNLTIGYNSPKTTTIVYDSENPRRPLYAAKVWEVPDPNPAVHRPTWRATLYYADRLEKYTADTQPSSMGGGKWTLTETVENPFGQIPVFHFRTSRPFGKPEHVNAYGPQDAINKIVAVQMATMDYQGAPQRYALATNGGSNEIEDFSEGDTDRENIGALRNGPGELWYLKGVDEVGQFDPADPDVFLSPMKEYVRSMASLTSTPLHYFERTGNVPSGEALRVAEAPLLKKVRDRELAFESAWRDLFRFALRVEGLDEDVQVKWQPVESIDSLDTWEVALKKRNAGLPLSQVLAEMGYDIEVIEKLEAQASNEPTAVDAAGVE